MREVFDGIWQSGYYAGLPPHTDCVVNLTPEADAGRPRALLWVPIDDGPFPGVPWLDMVVDFLRITRGWQTLVHCAAGLSRASLVTTAYLMKSRKLGRDAALALLRTRVPNANPNPDFLTGLASYENFLRSTGQL